MAFLEEGLLEEMLDFFLCNYLNCLKNKDKRMRSILFTNNQ